jgi:hypothetical protein
MAGKKQHLEFTVEHEDVGATMLTTIRVNGQHIISYLPATRHLESAEDTATRVLAHALGGLIKEAVEADPHARVVSENYARDGWDEEH